MSMLKVDLARLETARRVPIETAIKVDDPVWGEADVRPAAPVDVKLVVEKVGPDVVARGGLRGEVELPCRRCLIPVRLRFGEEVTFHFRSGVDPARAEIEEAYALPANGRVLDLKPAVREHVLLALPAFALCREECRGLCPRCGADRNWTECSCEEEHGDERWAVLRRLRTD